MAVTTEDQNKVDTTFDNENNGDETVGAVGVETRSVTDPLPPIRRYPEGGHPTIRRCC